MIQGIDVSAYQGVIDWPKVAAAGIRFAMIRAGYGGELSQKDKYFDANITGASQNGIAVGVYWFSYSTDEEDAKKEAGVFRQVISPYRESITFPAAFDYEYDSIRYAQKSGQAPDNALINVMAAAFIADLKADGWVPAIYTNLDFMRNRFTKETLALCDVWLADYDGEADAVFSIRQTGSKGSVDGISGNVDLDVIQDDYAPVVAAAKDSPAAAQNAPSASGSAAGSGSDTVRAVQRHINSLHIALLAADGISGPGTQAAVKAFQRICGLTADALWGPNTDGAYREITAKPTLKSGSKGIPVRYVQFRSGASADGIFGPKTDAAVKTWQKRNALAADGIVGPRTWAKLMD